MKKGLILVIIALVVSVSFGCNNSLTIYSNNNIGLIQSALIYNGDYNIVKDNNLYYFSVNNSVNIRVNNNSISFFSNNSSVNWTNLIFNELSFLKAINATNLSNDEILFLSNRGCCGTFSNNIFSTKCSSGFSVPIIKSNSGYINIVVPLLLIFNYLFYKRTKGCYLIMILGFVLAFVSFMLSIILLFIFNNDNNLLINFILSFSEFLVIYLIIKYNNLSRLNSFSLGLGFGLFKLLFMFTIPILFLIHLNQPITFLNTILDIFKIFNIIFLTIITINLVRLNYKSNRNILLIFLLFFLMNYFFKFFNNVFGEFFKLIINLLIILLYIWRN